MAKTKRTPIQTEYYKQRKRLQSALSRERNAGYVFTDNVLPQIPKRITKASVDRLKKIKPKDLRSKATGIIDLETGEYIKRTKNTDKEIEILAKQQKPKRIKHDNEYTDAVIDSHPETIPTFDIIDYIISKLRSLPFSITKIDRLSGKPRQVTVDMQRSNEILVEVINRQVAEYGAEAMVAHLNLHESEIQESISDIEITRYLDEVIGVYHKLMSLISIDPLFNDVREAVDDYANMWGEEWSAFD